MLSQPTITPPPPFPAATPAAQADATNACWASWISYRSASISTDLSLDQYPGTSVTLSKYVQTFYDVETVDYDNIAWTTLCDRRKREVSSQPTTTLAKSYLTNYNYTTWYPSSIHRTNVVPKCTYLRDDPTCSRLWISWSSSTSAAKTQTTGSALADLLQYAIPPCPEPQWPCPVKPDLRECTVGADETGTMYYWPVTTVSGDFCAQNGTTLTPKPTNPGHPNTIVYHGETFTSPSVYLVYPSVTAYYSSGRAAQHTIQGYCGPTVTDVTLTMEPKSVFSVGFKDPSTPMSISWDDFNVVPLPSWAESCPVYLGCTGWVGSPIKNYQPFIQIPHDIIKMDKRNWGNCTGWGYIQPKLIRLEPGMTTKGGWHAGVLGTVTEAAPTGTISPGLPKDTDSFP